ncbi:MAG: bifunctional 5,10-methylene-tetrahydrofolate dehydrogenase/5,10-methylene-tetrahydrofolate cyclohydrolase [Verrucomicrobiota bacterium]|nr:bifunctional 5,10-methylene-tetrahydrofolate dehydrogenase/5,10-methylene-tetrahydrofolate cyclohydrolase [Verrucomicrobiota bacterium]
MLLIDGRAIARKFNEASRVAVAQLKALGHTPGLAVVMVGENAASRAYVRSKDKMCQELGMHSVKHELPAATTQQELVTLVRQLNADPAIHGILVQSPPPPHIAERAVVETIDPRKDVDGFHPMNVARLVLGDPDGFVPCTPLGCQRLLMESGVDTRGSNVVVLGRSMIVGKPMALLLMNKGPGGDATVTVAHSRTKDLPGVCHGADILIAAIGQPELVKKNFVKDGAVVIDVGINRVPASATPKGWKLVGDVAFAEVAPRCRAITPVPGGVGPMTIAMLMHNTIESCRRFAGRR